MQDYESWDLYQPRAELLRYLRNPLATRFSHSIAPSAHQRRDNPAAGPLLSFTAEHRWCPRNVRSLSRYFEEWKARILDSFPRSREQSCNPNSILDFSLQGNGCLNLTNPKCRNNAEGCQKSLSSQRRYLPLSWTWRLGKSEILFIKWKKKSHFSLIKK